MVEVVNISINTKCAEIHCDTSVEANFLIKCICGSTFLDYVAFQQHFISDHFQPELHNVKEENTGAPISCLNEPVVELPSLSELPPVVETGYDAFTFVESKRQPDKRRNGPNSCAYCGRTFRRRYLLDTHLNIHTGSKPHQCDMCGKQFRAVSTLTRHLRTHEDRKELQCQHCEKLFTHRSALLSHELRHTQLRCWACNSCDKSFYTRNQMDTHKRKMHATGTTHKGQDQADNAELCTSLLPFTCELCGNSYRSASTLSTHKLKKHYRLAKYSCELCDKKFVDFKHLQQHQFIHVKPEATINS
ncbi:PREDICTED: zinc finger protein 254-like [Drosophila arizonae]|uniref:Zinc finger protein 254-like n=1 Tax=Drosophila arizonae TaxID=7263 RepID=A0ABM1PP67_DROAR|nr:PREDICTED: zinc finger protein 254-like [Drosophila arizonae]